MSKLEYHTHDIGFRKRDIEKKKLQKKCTCEIKIEKKKKERKRDHLARRRRGLLVYKSTCNQRYVLRLLFGKVVQMSERVVIFFLESPNFFQKIRGIAHELRRVGSGRLYR